MVLNDVVMGDTTTDWSNSNPEIALNSEGLQAEAEELDTTTLDPSYIIHLIRQLLPEVGSGTAGESLAKCRDDAFLHGSEQAEGLAEGDQVSAAVVTEEEQPARRIHGCRSSKPDHESRSVVADGHEASLEEYGERAGSPDTLVGTVSREQGSQDEGLEAANDVEEQDHHEEAVSESKEDPREEAGCVLWDLAASQSHADFLVENHILDVLLAIIRIPQSERMREICLGILGNLACHLGPEKVMVATQGLLETVVQQLSTDDSSSLIEECRLLSAGLHSDVATSWVAALKSEETLERIMWIAGNTLNPQLLEKSTELLLAMVDSKTSAASGLLPILLKLGLAELLTDLLACEVTTISAGSPSQGDVVLDIVLQIAEALSISDEHATQLAANQKLFSLTCEVIRLSSRDEIGPSGITAAVLVANLLSEEAGFIHEVSCDAVLSERLFAMLPSGGEDPGARNAIWSILNRICKSVGSIQSEEASVTAGLIEVFAAGSRSLVKDLDAHREEDLREEQQRVLAGYDAAAITSRGLHAKLATASNMIAIMEQWASWQCQTATEDVESAKNACNFLGHHVNAIKQRHSLEQGMFHPGWPTTQSDGEVVHHS